MTQGKERRRAFVLDAVGGAVGLLVAGCAPAALQGTERKELAVTLRQFIRMYRPHEAREDTVLFPAFRGLVGSKEYEELGDAFEDKEHALFGAQGFEGVVAEVAKLEQALGIYDLAAFTPR